MPLYLLLSLVGSEDDEVTWIATIDRSATGSRRSFQRRGPRDILCWPSTVEFVVAKFDGQQSQDENTVGGSSDIRGANCDTSIGDGERSTEQGAGKAITLLYTIHPYPSPTQGEPFWAKNKQVQSVQSPAQRVPDAPAAEQPNRSQHQQASA